MHLNNDTRGPTTAAAAPTPRMPRASRSVRSCRPARSSATWATPAMPSGRGPHTHFELHIDGTAVNPYPYLVDVHAARTPLPRSLPSWL